MSYARSGGYCYHPRGGGYCYRPGRGGYCYRPGRRSMGADPDEVTSSNFLRFIGATALVGISFILVSGQLEKQQSKRRKRRG